MLIKQEKFPNLLEKILRNANQYVSRSLKCPRYIISTIIFDNFRKTKISTICAIFPCSCAHEPPLPANAELPQSLLAFRWRLKSGRHGSWQFDSSRQISCWACSSWLYASFTRSLIFLLLVVILVLILFWLTINWRNSLTFQNSKRPSNVNMFFLFLFVRRIW